MNPNTPGVGFQPNNGIPSYTKLAALKQLYTSIVSHWRIKKLKTVFAYLNALTYRACRIMGVIKQVRPALGEKKGYHRINGIHEAIAKGIRKFNVTIEGIADQLFNFWGIKISEASLRAYRYELRDTFRLFHFESQPLPLGAKGDRNARRPPALERFNLPSACILLEVLEEALVNQKGCELEDFPGKAAMGRLIYNAIFKGILSYRRKRLAEDHAVFFQGDTVIHLSEMDWNVELNERCQALWLGQLHLIPDEAGLLPQRVE